ncbi:MAG: TIGR00730 family Rossman fold protein [Phenylobacterium sp.]|uniref:LOG family protein n=1 Tax=Phenylobacterium sp. TaxID=1871053 RepID=UPI001A44A29E|nr:TIGR00730 family Rossman fold protein [Phenylobacterium sp.]MBL8771022.1 TIGR00730 family Rossman fold protein [Phenylobacterium sp.]
MRRRSQRLESACVFCGSSDDADPAFLAAAEACGKGLADAGIRLVYGGGGVGLMGAAARAAHRAGGEVLGIIPTFLVAAERALETVEHIIVDNMHERKMLMFQRSDSFIILPGGIGTLEEVVELLSWRRLDLHAKPVVFYNPRGFWEPLFKLFQHTVDERLTPPEFMQAWVAVDTVDQIVPALLGQGRELYPSEAAVGRRG